MKKDLSFHIEPTLPFDAASDEAFLNAPVHLGPIDEKAFDNTPPACFLGAYYRKAVSNKDQWFGIEGTITLGEFVEDPTRYGNDKRIVYDRQLDNPSIYLGGYAETESDAGLGFSIGYTSSDTTKELHYGSKKVAYRPFYRYIYSDVTDNNGSVLRGNFNSWNVLDPREFDYYYFPGDKIKMSVVSPKENYLQLRIEVLEQTIIEKYKNIRDSFNLGRWPKTYYSPLFYSGGHGRMPAEFKRVNSIDQYGNEGFVVKKTNAKVTKARWHEVYLFTKVDGKLVKVPFNEKRYISMICPQKEVVMVENQNDLGGEDITIMPGNMK